MWHPPTLFFSNTIITSPNFFLRPCVEFLIKFGTCTCQYFTPLVNTFCVWIFWLLKIYCYSLHVGVFNFFSLSKLHNILFFDPASYLSSLADYYRSYFYFLSRRFYFLWLWWNFLLAMWHPLTFFFSNTIITSSIFLVQPAFSLLIKFRTCLAQ
jgi:hypothetical protein